MERPMEIRTEDELDDLRQEIADALGWSYRDACSFSLTALAAMLRGNPDHIGLYNKIKAIIANEEHVFVRPRRHPWSRR